MFKTTYVVKRQCREGGFFCIRLTVLNWRVIQTRPLVFCFTLADFYFTIQRIHWTVEIAIFYLFLAVTSLSNDFTTFSTSVVDIEVMLVCSSFAVLRPFTYIPLLMESCLTHTDCNGPNYPGKIFKLAADLTFVSHVNNRDSFAISILFKCSHRENTF